MLRCLLVMLGQPLLDFPAGVPTGIIPDYYQIAFPLITGCQLCQMRRGFLAARARLPGPEEFVAGRLAAQIQYLPLRGAKCRNLPSLTPAAASPGQADIPALVMMQHRTVRILAYDLDKLLTAPFFSSYSGSGLVMRRFACFQLRPWVVNARHSCGMLMLDTTPSRRAISAKSRNVQRRVDRP